MSPKGVQKKQKTSPKGPQKGQIGHFGSPKGPRRPFQGPKWHPRGYFLVSLGTKIGLRELIWGNLGSFGAVVAPKMPPRSSPRSPKGQFWDQKASRRGPKMRFWDPKLSKKGVSKGPRLSKCEFWVKKKTCWTKMGPSNPCNFTWCPEKLPPQSALFTHT